MQGTASAYVSNQRLCMLGIVQSPWGPIPFSHMEKCEAEDGPVDFATDLPDAVRTAIDQSEVAIMGKIKGDELTLAAEDLVDRARAGDQNAMGTIAMVRQRAKEGIPRAQKAFKALMKYAKATKPDSPFGNEENRSQHRVARSLSEAITEANPSRYVSALVGFTSTLSINTAGITLANGPPIDNSRIRSLASAFPDGETEQFKLGLKNWKRVPKDADHPAHRIGRCIGFARALQTARLPDTPIGPISARAGWELD